MGNVGQSLSAQPLLPIGDNGVGKSQIKAGRAQAFAIILSPNTCCKLHGKVKVYVAATCHVIRAVPAR